MNKRRYDEKLSRLSSYALAAIFLPAMVFCSRGQSLARRHRKQKQVDGKNGN